MKRLHRKVITLSHTSQIHYLYPYFIYMKFINYSPLPCSQKPKAEMKGNGNGENGT